MTDSLKRHGIDPPILEERQGFVIVTFKAPVYVVTAGLVKPESQPESLDRRVLSLLRHGELSKAELSVLLGQKEVSGQLNKVIRSQMADGLIEYTVKTLESTRKERRKRLFEAQDEIDLRRDELIANVEAQLSQTRTVKQLFTIRWTLVSNHKGTKARRF